MDNRPWIAREDAHLQADYATIKSVRVLAERLGRTVKEVHEQAAVLGIERPRGTDHYVRPERRVSAELAKRSAKTRGGSQLRPTRHDGEKLVAEYRDQDLTRLPLSKLKMIISLLSRLPENDYGLWEELIHKQATAALDYRRQVLTSKQLA